MALRSWAACAALLLSAGLSEWLSAETFRVPVTFDRWMYPFNATPGTRATGSVFGELESPDFDNRDAQIVFGFDVSDVARKSTSRKLSAVKLNLTTAADDSFVYDPTFDALDTYSSTADSDAGRPVELYGVSFRGAYTGLTLDLSSSDGTKFKENSPFSPTPRVFNGVRSVFASDYTGGTGRDISNNIRENFEVTPWAIGTTDVAPGVAVPMNTKLAFDLQLSNASAADYVRRGLDHGELFFTLSSMTSASLEGPLTAPSFYLDAGGQSLGPTAELVFEFSEQVLGDFDGDGQLSATDIDLLTAEVRAGSNDLRYDLTADNLVTADDRTHWVNDLKRTYFGDANLDGEFTSADFVSVFVAGQYEDPVPGNSTWATGDWNGDGDFGSGDFVLAFQTGGYERGPRLAVSSVPEPSSIMLLIIAVVMWGRLPACHAQPKECADVTE